METTLENRMDKIKEEVVPYAMGYFEGGEHFKEQREAYKKTIVYVTHPFYIRK